MVLKRTYLVPKRTQLVPKRTNLVPKQMNSFFFKLVFTLGSKHEQKVGAEKIAKTGGQLQK